MATRRPLVIAAGVVQQMPAGDSLDTTTYSASGTVVTDVELDFGSVPTARATFVVVDATVLATSRVRAWQSGLAATSRSADENEMDPIDCVCLPAAGSFKLVATALNGPVVGKFKFAYEVR